MATRARGARGIPDWTRNHPGVTIQRDPVSERVILVSHPAYPFVREWKERDDGAAGLFRIANEYLGAIELPVQRRRLLELPEDWLKDLQEYLPDTRLRGRRPRTRIHWPWLLWLPLNPSVPNDPDSDPRNSFWIERHLDTENPSPATLIDRTAVLLGCLFNSPERNFPFMGGQGIRIVMHVSRPRGGIARVRVTGMSTSLPRWPQDVKRIRALNVNAEFVKKLVTAVSRDFVLRKGEKLAELGISVTPQASKRSPRAFDIVARVLTKVVPGEDARADELAYSLSGELRTNRGQFELISLSKVALVASAAQGKVFDQDPMSKYGPGAYFGVRPNRPSKAFDSAQTWAAFPNLPAGAQPGKFLLDDGTVIVTNSRLVEVRGGARENDPKVIDEIVEAPTRTNTSAAVNAYYHASSLFQQLTDCGIVAATYFKFVSPRLTVRYRSGIGPGPGKDGNTINARVSLRPPELSFVPGQPEPIVISQGAVEVQFALGDLQCSPRRAPLGIACDPRWNWHEFCHVLLAAAVGELEFRFAHSAGDAMAAILCDPYSQLAANKNWRGVTFPWVSLPARRHDRPVNRGWGWAGSLYQRERFFVIPGRCDKRGYWTEQILSTSLFRLYRAIGGDTDSYDASGAVTRDAFARSAAADHAVFLIMQAISLLGPAAVVPALTPQEFVDALIKADIGTEQFGADSGIRFGGLVRKVIRWAFQQQGLYHPGGGAPINRPGQPEPVDLHIARKPKPGPQDGVYAPVNFLDDFWHAAPKSLWVRRLADGQESAEQPRANKDNFIYVRVQNLGPDKADNVHVDVWWVQLPASGAVPDFQNTVWQAIGFRAGNVPGLGKKKFGPFKWRPPQGGQKYALLAVATCPGDRANIDPASELPCALTSQPISTAQLVAWDNNLGLRVVSA